MDNHQVLDVGGKQQGHLCSRKLVPDKNNGKLLSIKNTIQSQVSSSCQFVRFLHVAVDATGERIVSGDHHGNVYLFDFTKNRFCKICSVGASLTAITWNSYRVNEILIALSNFELRCYNVGSMELVNIMKCHDSAVHSISIHGSGRYALSSSFDTTILWDLNTFMKKRTLNGAQDVGVQKVFFLPNSNKIVSCFKDDSVFVWDCETMKCLYQLSSPVGKKPGYKCLSATNDCRVLAAGGRSRFIYLWNLDSRMLIQVIELPEKIKEVKELEFVTDNFAVNQHQLLAVLGQDGILRFIDTHNCKLHAEIGSVEQRIYSFAMGKNMRYVVAVLDNGCIAVHLLSHILKPQGTKPVVQKVITRSEGGEQENVETCNVERNVKKCKKRLRKPSDKNNTSSVGDVINTKRLKAILKGYGEYPEKYRLFIWRSILQLPENHVAFSVLVDKGTHNAFAILHEKYPIKSRKLLRVLQRVLSAIAYWSPIFGETDYLPMMVFPIVKMFPNNQLICFEVVITILLNWCQKWFEFFPNPPLSILSMIESILGHHDAALLEHFIKFKISAQTYAWPLLHTLFSEILTKEQWMIVWDNLFSNPPSFMLFFVVSYLIGSRQTLLSCKSEEDFQFFFHHKNAVDIPSIIKETYRIASSTPASIDPKKVLDDFRSVPVGQYPVFDCYPKFIVDYLVEERERIREEELDYLRQKQAAIDIKKQRELTRREELAYYREQENVIKAEQQRRELISNEENKLAAQRKKLQSLRRDVALQELDVLDEVRRNFLHHQQQVKNVELQRLDDELNRKMLQRDEETKAALEDAEIKALEIEAQKRNFQEGLMRDNVESSFHLQVEKDILRKQQENKDERLRQIIDRTQAVDAETMKNYQIHLARLGQNRQHVQMKTDLDARTKLWNLEREIQALQIAKKDFDNKLREADLHDVMRANIEKQHEQLLTEKLEEKNLRHSIDDDISFGSDAQRGSFNEAELNLMSQVRDVRRKMTQRKHITVP
ncbi:TBC1 domain family member 31-like isoform X2 [Hydractinia symbiolongicarpus]|uniref:TBC1 domain family member 31-like isoform X2 n=1 Tax=Hydractinia symbiolongicarpus TaxID=13093 RepID=UPI00254A04CD|nr:TBC1 domain family member 31-like isoform X2 [Hydractinia symbiolongicarpus]